MPLRAGTTIALVTAVESAIEPARELLLEEAAAAGCALRIGSLPAPGAWDLLELGDHDAYLVAIARHVESIDPSFDVVVLAQASMLGAELLVGASTRPVLVSPRLAVEQAIQLAG